MHFFPRFVKRVLKMVHGILVTLKRPENNLFHDAGLTEDNVLEKYNP